MYLVSLLEFQSLKSASALKEEEAKTRAAEQRVQLTEQKFKMKEKLQDKIRKELQF